MVFLWVVVVVLALMVLWSLLAGLFLTKEGLVGPYYQERFWWRVLPRMIWFVGMVVVVGGALFAGMAGGRGSVEAQMENLMEMAAVGAILAGPAALLLARGHLDFSVGGVMVLCGMVFVFLANEGMPVPVAAAAGIGCGVVAGIINGVIVSVSRMSSALVTLAMLPIWMTLGMAIMGRPTGDFTRWGRGWADVGLITGWVAAGVLLVTLMVLGEFTPIGRRGRTDPEAENVWQRLLYVGVPLMFSGMAAGAAAMVLALTSGSISAALGSTIWLGVNALAAVAIGGTAYRGRNPGILGAMVGAIMVQAFDGLMAASNIETDMRTMIVPLALLGFGILAMQYSNFVAWLYHRKVRKGSMPGMPAEAGGGKR